MKRYKLITLIVLVLYIAINYAMMQQNDQGPQTIVINVNPSQSTTVTASQDTKQSNQSSTTATTSTKAGVQSMIDQTATLLKKYGKQAVAELKKNKYIFAGTLGAVSYTYLCLEVAHGNAYLKNSSLWSSWKSELTLEELCACPQETVAHELNFSLQYKHIDRKNPINPISSLTTFVDDLEQEQQRLLYYQKLHTWLKKSRLIAIIPIETAAYETIKDRLQRIAYIKSVFFTWVAQNKQYQTAHQ